jgi:TPR repeat protein
LGLEELDHFPPWGKYSRAAPVPIVLVVLTNSSQFSIAPTNDRWQQVVALEWIFLSADADENDTGGYFFPFPDSSPAEGISNLLRSNAQKLKVAADEANAVVQYNYGICLQNGKGVSIDFEGAAHYLKLAADQGIAVAQFNYRLCLWNAEGVSIDFQGAAHYFKLAADQGIAEAQSLFAICLLTGDALHRNHADAFRYLKLPAENGSQNGQFVCCIHGREGRRN